MMSQRNLITAALLGGVIKRTAAHFRAQGTGIFFLPNIKDNGFDIGLAGNVFHIQFFAQLSYRCEIISS